MFIMINLLWICWWIIISSINIITLLCLGLIMIVILPVLMMMTNETWLYKCYDSDGLDCKYLLNYDLIWSVLICISLSVILIISVSETHYTDIITHSQIPEIRLKLLNHVTSVFVLHVYLYISKTIIFILHVMYLQHDFCSSVCELCYSVECFTDYNNSTSDL